MPSAGISVNPECVETFNDLKMGKGLNYVIFAIADDGKEIIVDEKGTVEQWDEFREKLLAKQDPKAAGKTRPSFAVYDISFELADGGKRSKIVFITYIDQSETAIKSRMVYASSREDLKSALNGIAMDWQATEKGDLEYDDLLKEASKGKQLV